MSYLAFSLVSCASLLFCAHHASPADSLAGALRWASYTTLLGVFVHLLWCGWQRYRPQGREEYTEVEIDGNGMETGEEVRARVIVFPEISMASV